MSSTDFIITYQPNAYLDAKVHPSLEEVCRHKFLTRLYFVLKYLKSQKTNYVVQLK